MLRIFFLFFLFIASSEIFAQAVVVSSYLNAADPRDEWTELLVVGDNTDIRNWTLQDNNAAQTAFQPWINFASISLWNNLRAGTIIMVWHRSIGSTGTIHPIDQDKSDGYLEVSANDPAFFILTNANFGTSPFFAGATLNVAAGGDLLQLLNSTGTFVHALGHIPTIPSPPPPAPGGSWHTIPLPKLNQKSNLANGEAVFICPGTNINEYGWNAPQDGTTFTSKAASPNISFGLPNQCATSSTTNSAFWRGLRQPAWSSPTLNGTVNAGNTQVTLNWIAATDPNSADGTQGYLILRNSTNTFTDPTDGHTYSVGDVIGGASVIAMISSSQTVTYFDNFSVPCPAGVYYRVYAYRYTTDNSGVNDLDKARGRAYNETDFGACQVTGPMPVAPLTAASDRNNFCADDPGNIILSATGGSGSTLNWFEGSCGGTSIGTGNNLSIPSPAVTTTYYVRWENGCGNSSCASVTVTVNTLVTVSVTITADPGNTVCSGTSVTFTATPTNGGTTPSYQWKKNGGNVGTNSPTYTYAPANSDNITCVLTSNSSCASGNPATSNGIVMTVNTTVPVSVVIQADPGNAVCTGTSVTYTATPTNGGTTPSYQWKKNGGNVGTNSPTYTYTPANGDNITCVLTSNSTCASGNPATSNSIIMTVNTTVPVGVTIAANPGNTVCTGTSVTYTATPTNGGTTPAYQWKVNNVNFGSNSPTYTYTPVNGDNITCVLTSNSSCASGNPATSNSIIMTVNTTVPVSVVIQADPGNSVCTGTSVTFTATPANEGTTPVYQWKVNGGNMGTNSPTFVYTPSNGDNVTVELTSSSSCASGNPATSNNIIMGVSSSVPVGVSILASENPVCTGSLVTFTATPANPGTNPVYQWKVNGSNAGSNSDVYSFVPNDGDNVIVVLTSNSSCAIGNPATSNNIVMNVSSSVTVGVSILASENPTCTGNPVTFTATPVNPGTLPVYQWKVKGANAGTNNSTYTYVPVNGDNVNVVMTSNSSCASGNPATSNNVIMDVSSSVPVSISITADPGTTVCAGTVVTFTADAVNGGTQPSFQWYKNGGAVGGNSDTWSDVPADGDVIYCMLTSDLSCAANNPATSASLSMSISASLDASVTLVADHTAVCQGTIVTLSAIPVNQGSSPQFQWLIDGVPVQQGSSPEYITSSLIPGQNVECSLTSSLTCVSANPVVSPPLSFTAAPAPVVKLTDKDYLCAGQAVVLDAGAGFSAYLWQDGSTERYYSAEDVGEYYVTVTDSIECKGSDTVSFRKCGQNLYAPTAFSPNGDNLNDLFILLGEIDEMTSFSMSIFNRWGELIFMSSDIKAGWDGTQNGKYCPPDTYTWLVKYQVSSSSSDAEPVVMKGTFTLVR